MSTPARRSALAATVLVALTLPALVPGAVAGEAAPAVEAAGPEAGTQDAEATDLAARRLIVRWADGVDAATRAEVLGAVDARVVHDLGALSAVQLDGATASAEAAERLRDDRRVATVEPDRVVRTATADPGYGQQWGIDNTGQTVQQRVGRAGIDTRALEAWDDTAGESSVVVAIVDSGVDVGHPDLGANIWSNPEESANGLDDDGNGLVDDRSGWDFKNDDATVYDHPDGDSHGTELAGVIAGVRDNEVGITGIAPGVRIMPVKFLEGGVGTISDGLAGLRYAAEQGANVIVASWVGERDHANLRDVLEGTRVLVVAPAGNDGRDLSLGAASYPASYTLSNLVSVAAIDNRGALAGFSNRGSREVDLAAPGQYVLTTDPEGGYAYVSGTSMAAAFTAGAAALALSVNPRLPAAELAELIRLSTRPYVSVADATISGGFLDAARLVELASDAAKSGACLDPPPSDFEDVSRGSVHVKAIDCLVHREGTEGRSEQEFAPREPVTRAAMATFLHRVVIAAKKDVEDPPDAFTDDDGSIHEPGIDAVAALGIVEGREDGTYGPAEVVTRAQMATMLRRTYAAVVGSNTYASRSWFDDLVAPHDESINAMRDLGIVSGSHPREFDPAAGVRRDQMASFLVAVLDVFARRGLIIVR